MVLSSPKSLGALDVAGVAMRCGSIANGGERALEELVLPESGLSWGNVRKSNGEAVMGGEIVCLGVSRSAWMLGKLNPKLFLRSHCGSTKAGLAGGGRHEEEGDGMA